MGTILRNTLSGFPSATRPILITVSPTYHSARVRRLVTVSPIASLLKPKIAGGLFVSKSSATDLSQRQWRRPGPLILSYFWSCSWAVALKGPTASGGA